MHNSCNVKLQIVYDNISHVMLYYYKVLSGIVLNQIVTHVNEVSLGISMISANTEKPR